MYVLCISQHYECKATFTEQPLIISSHIRFLCHAAQTKDESTAFHFKLKRALEKTTDFHINHASPLLLCLWTCMRIYVHRTLLLAYYIIPPLPALPRVVLGNVKC